jgi:copper(I)-binding protein
MKFPIFIAAALLIAGTISASAHEEKSETLTISHPWTRATAPTQKAGAVFMKIRSENSEADRLIGVSAPDAEQASLHTHIRDGDVMRMRPVEGIDVPAEGEATLEPGGLHIMLIGLKGPLFEETTIPLTLVFEKAGKVQIDVVVEEAGAQAASQETMQSHDKHGMGR